VRVKEEKTSTMSGWSERDLAQLNARGSTVAEVERQIAAFRSGFPPTVLVLVFFLQKKKKKKKKKIHFLCCFFFFFFLLYMYSRPATIGDGLRRLDDAQLAAGERTVQYMSFHLHSFLFIFQKPSLDMNRRPDSPQSSSCQPLAQHLECSKVHHHTINLSNTYIHTYICH
jgi:hypothetical protein